MSNAIDNQVDNERILADATLHRPLDHKVCSEGTVNRPESQNGKSNSENDISNMPDLAKSTTTTEENFAEGFSEDETTNHELTSSYIQFARVDDIIFADTATNQIDLYYVDLPSNAAQHKKLPASGEVSGFDDLSD